MVDGWTNMLLRYTISCPNAIQFYGIIPNFAMDQPCTNASIQPNVFQKFVHIDYFYITIDKFSWIDD